MNTRIRSLLKLAQPERLLEGTLEYGMRGHAVWVLESHQAAICSLDALYSYMILLLQGLS